VGGGCFQAIHPGITYRRGDALHTLDYNLKSNYIHEIIILYVICNKNKHPMLESKCFWYFMYVIRKITKLEKRYGLNKSVCNLRDFKIVEIHYNKTIANTKKATLKHA
jgi:hypothetical protein